MMLWFRSVLRQKRKYMIAAFEFDAIGTAWRILLPKELLPARRAALLHMILERIELFDKAYSRFRADSLVTQMSLTAGEYELPSDAEALLSLYRKLYDLTAGAFTPLIGQTLSEAGYDAEYSLQSKTLHAPPSWDEVLSYVSPRLTLKRPALIDFGAGGKGYLADLVAEVLEREGVKEYCIDASGDIVYKGAQPIRVALEDPREAGKAIGVAAIAGGSICGSAGNRRQWEDFHHTIDPRTLKSPKHILATWVIASNGLLADALATALYFVPATELLETFSFEYVLMHADFQVEYSQGAPIELFTE